MGITVTGLVVLKIGELGSILLVVNVLFFLIAGIVIISLIIQQMKFKKENLNLNKLLDELPVMILRHKVNTAEVYTNKTFNLITGWKGEKGKVEELMKFCYPDEEYRDHAQKVINEGNGWNCLNIKSVKGENIESEWLKLKTEEGDIIGVGIDIREKLKAYKALEESEEKYRRLVENAKDIIFRYSLEEPKGFEYVNSAIEQYGFKLEDIYSNPDLMFEIIYPEDIAKLKKIFRGESIGEYLRWVGMDGELGWTDHTVYKVHNDEGELIAIEGVFRDVTKIIKEERELKRALKKAEEMNRIKNLFLANMSHELRTPLVGILGYAGILAEELVNQELKGMAQFIAESGERLKSTLNSLLDFSKIEAEQIEIQFTLLNLVEEIKEVVKLYEIYADKKGLHLELTGFAEGAYIKGDKKLFNSIITNLVNNAVKFTEKGRVTLNVETEGNLVTIKVTDTGIGFKEEDKDKIFQPFRQISEGRDRNFEGTGLGLAIVKKYTDLLGGKIDISSHPGKGSEFKLTFNLCNNLVKGEKRGTDLCGKGGIKQRILLVEDENSSAGLIIRLLSKDYIVDRVAGGEEALIKLEEINYQVILMDVCLKGKLDGVEVANIAKKKGILTPIVAITALAFEQDKRRILENGCDYYIAKPFKSEDLRALVNNITCGDLRIKPRLVSTAVNLFI
jgi:PAS domain S-box-containing protein